ncbi:MAG: beta-lactamase family protein [Actinomycetota bacterium]|nr:beta-lactamase family protein [Actinomycetota bacterium]
MTALTELLDRHVAEGTVPGVVAALGDVDGDLEVASAGDLATDAIVRIQSMTKPVLAVATLRMVQSGRLGLDDAVQRWLPELANRQVLRASEADLDEVVPAAGPITVRHLLTNASGYGMILTPSPLQEAMAANETEAGPDPPTLGAEAWLTALAELPLVHQPGAGWRYHHSFGILGILLSRLTGRTVGEHLAADLFGPLGMVDTAYSVPLEKADRLPAAYRREEDGELVQLEPHGSGFHVGERPFDVSHDELVSTARDYAAFVRMLAADGRHNGDEILEPGLLHEMRSDQVQTEAKTPDSFFPGFWDGMGWGYGVAVQTSGDRAGSYGWSGGLGTDVFVDPDGSFGVLLTQVEMGPHTFRLMEDLRML